VLQFSCPNFQESPLPFDESAGFTAPSAFGTYRVLHQIGSGVLGPVFRTYDPQRDRLVAVKAFRLDVVPEQVARLADALRRLAAAAPDRPGIVPAIEAGLEGTTAYLATEYVAAETLDVALRHLAPAPLDLALPILSQIAEAIDAAWASGAGHGALHPRDVFVTVDTHDVRITGFGVVPALESTGIKAPIRRPYAAPERTNGEPWDIRADVYSLGAIAHELLTRRRPAGSGEQDGALTPGTTPEQRVQIRRVLSAVLAERPQHRFQSARAFTDALAAIGRGDAVAWPVADHLDPALAHQDPGELIASDRPHRVVPAVVPDFDSESPVAAAPAIALAVAAETAEPVAAARVWEPYQAPIPEATLDPDLLRPTADGSVVGSERAFVSESLDSRAEHVPPGREPFAPRPLDAGLEALATRRGPSPFPWGATSAVAAAGIVVGIVIGYTFGARHQVQGGPPQTTTAAETDVPVPASESAPSTPTPAAAADSELAPVVRAAARKGRVIVRSTPPGALLVIDGRPHGQTPVAVNDLAFGSHAIEVARSGYVPYTETVTLAAKNAVRTVTVRLQPGLGSGGTATASAAIDGSVYVDSRPRQARVLIDGRVIGTTPLRIPALHAGSHAVRLELVGYQPFTTTVGVKAGEETRVTATLEEK
jgi:hypothetical protein